MEDSWFLSTPMLLNATTMTLEMKETNNQKELFIVSDEMTNILEHFGKKLVQQKEDNLKKINQLEAYLTITLDEFEQYI